MAKYCRLTSQMTHKVMFAARVQDKQIAIVVVLTAWHCIAIS